MLNLKQGACPARALEAGRVERGISPIKTLKGRRRRAGQQHLANANRDVTFREQFSLSGLHLCREGDAETQERIGARGRTKNGGPWVSGD